MNVLDYSESQFDSKAASFAKSGIVQVPLFATGFIMGATEANATANNKTAGSKYTLALDWRLADTLTNLGIGGVNVPNVSKATTATSYTSLSGAAKINYVGWLNKGLAAAVLGWVWKESKLPMGDTAYALLKPYGLGYSVGGIFDPPGPGSVVNYPQGSSPQAQQSGPANTPYVASYKQNVSVLQ